jgi:hypothetical protein
MEAPRKRIGASRWLAVAAVSIPVAAVGTAEAGTAAGQWALLLAAIAVGTLVSTALVWILGGNTTPQPTRPLGRWGVLVMTAGIATVPFWQASDAAPIFFAAIAGFVVTTDIHFRSWPT